MEPEFVHQRGQMRAQHGNAIGRGGEGGARPQPGMQGQAGDRRAIPQRSQHEIEQHGAVHGGNPVRFHQQGHALAFLEPFERALARFVGQDRRIVHPGNAEAVGARTLAVDLFMRNQREIAIEEPAQQRAAIAVGQPIGILAHRYLHFQPVVHRAAHIAQDGAQIRLQRAALLGVHPLDLDIDKAFGPVRPLAALPDGLQLARCRPVHRQDGVDQPVDRNALRGDGVGHRVDQKRHVVIDDRKAHHAQAVHPGQAGGIDLWFCLAAFGGGVQREGGGGAAGLIVEILVLARQGAGPEGTAKGIEKRRIDVPLFGSRLFAVSHAFPRRPCLSASLLDPLCAL